MNAWTRVLSSLGLLSACLTGLSYVQPRWCRSLGLDWEKLAEARRTLREERQVEARLDETMAVLRRRIQAKARISRELAAGKVTLFKAAALFRVLNDGPEGRPNQYRTLWPGRSDGEKLCRQVIAWTHCELSKSAHSQADELRCRLEGELEEHIRRHGTVKLPRE
jgi:hypothetical protein